MKQRIYDPHVHFFAYAQGDYHWLKRDSAPFWPRKRCIRRDFDISDLALSPNFTLEGVTHIEAGFDNLHPERELHWLQNTGFRGSAIAFAQIDLPPCQFSQALSVLQHPLLRGIRDITEGDEGARLLDAHVEQNLAHLASLGLIWEAQFDVSDESLVRAVIHYAQQIGQLSIVINHAGLVTKKNWLSWQRNLALLAPFTNVHLKCCGWEITEPNSDNEWRQQVINYATSVFSSERVMLASNFPLCLFASSYDALWQSYKQLGLIDFDALAYRNAFRLYSQ